MTAPSIVPPNPPAFQCCLPPVIALVLLLARDAEASDRTSPPSWRYSANFGLSNDNFPAAQIFVPAERLDPYAPSLADDDGRTMGAVFEQALTNERQGLQIITSTWYEMLTQDGAQEKPWQDRRADVLNNILQVNGRFDLGRGWSVFAGIGAGLQTVGNLNGRALQQWRYREGGFGGRQLGHGLQDDYGEMRGSMTLPAASIGVRLGKRAGDDERWHVLGSGGYSALIAMGRTGMSVGQLDLSGRAGHGKIADLWASVFLSGGYINDNYLSFAPIEHGAFGYDVGVSLNLLRNFRVPICPYVTVQSNGSGLADTTYTIGFMIGHVTLVWLRPPR